MHKHIISILYNEIIRYRIIDERNEEVIKKTGQVTGNVKRKRTRIVAIY